MMKSVCCLFKGLENSNSSKHRTFQNVTVTGRLFVLKKISSEQNSKSSKPLHCLFEIFELLPPPKKKISKKISEGWKWFLKDVADSQPLFLCARISP